MEGCEMRQSFVRDDEGEVEGNPTMQNPLLLSAPDREIYCCRQYGRWKSREIYFHSVRIGIWKVEIMGSILP